MNNYKQKILYGGAYTFIGKIIVLFLGIMNSVILARLLGPENLGLISILSGINALVIPLIMFGIPTALTKYFAEYNVKDKEILNSFLSTGFTMMLVLAVCGSIIYFILSDYIGIGIYNTSIISLLIKIDSLFIIFTVLTNLGYAILNGSQRIKKMAKLQIINSAISLPILYFFAIKMSLIGAIIAGIISNLINFFLTMSILLNIIRQENLNIKFHVDKKIFTSILKFSFPILLSIFILRPAYLFGNSYLLIINGSKDVGLFKIAYSFYNQMLLLPAALSIPLLPIISELHTINLEKHSAVNSKIMNYVLLISLPICLTGALFSKYIISFMYGNAYSNAQTIVYIMFIVSFYSSYFIISDQIFVGTGRTWQVLGFDAFTAFIFVVFSYYLINLYGLTGLGLSFLLVHIIKLPIESIYLSKKSVLNLSSLKTPLLLSSIFIPMSYILIKYTQGFEFIIYSSTIIICLLLIEFLTLTQADKALISQAIKTIRS